MKKIMLFITLLICCVSSALAQTAQSVKDFTFGDNQIITKRNLLYLKGDQPVMEDDWRILNAKGYIGGTSQFVMIAYDEPNITQTVMLTGKTSYDASRNCKFFGYKYGNITGKASLFLDKGYYVFQFVADRLSDGTEKIYMYYFK